MIEAASNLACLQHGADPQYIKLHAQTQKELKYHLKHKYGISEEYNTYSPESPWHEMGQGAGNTSNQWVLGMDSMSDAYTQSPRMDTTFPIQATSSQTNAQSIY